MAGGASMNQMVQMGKQSAMKEKLRKKMEIRKMREQQASAQQASPQQALVQQASAQQALAQQASAQKSVVVKIGNEKQEKSNINALSEEELIKLCGSKKKDKKKK